MIWLLGLLPRWILGPDPRLAGFWAEARGGRVRTVSRWLGVCSAFVPEALRAFQGLRLVPVPVGRVRETQGDMYYYGDSREQVEALGLVEVHNRGYVGQGVKIGVFDTGFDLEHPSISHLAQGGGVVAAWDFNSGDWLLWGDSALPMPVDQPPVYINGLSADSSAFALALAPEDSLLYEGVGKWWVWLYKGGSYVKIAQGYRPFVLDGDTVLVAYTSPGGQVSVAGVVGETVAWSLPVAEGTEARLAKKGDTVYLVFWGDGLCLSVSTDGGQTFAPVQTLVPDEPLGGISSPLVIGDTLAVLMSDGDTVSLVRWAGGSARVEALGPGIMPAMAPVDSPLVAWVRESSVVWGYLGHQRELATWTWPWHPRVGSYDGQPALVLPDSAGRITVWSLDNQLLWQSQDPMGDCPVLWAGRALYRRRGDPDVSPPDEGPGRYHGTKVLSVMAGLSEGRLVGTAPGATYILAKTEKVVRADGGEFENQVEEDFWVSALEWAASQGARIVSSSLGYVDWYSPAQLDGETPLSSRAASMALSRGVLVMNAMGNTDPRPLPPQGVGDTSLVAPADARGIIAVGGVVKEDEGWVPSASSGFGPSGDGRVKPELVAPFTAVVAIETTYYGISDTVYYGVSSGTSFSVALAAGAAACVWSGHPSWSASKLRGVLLATASQLPGYSTPNYLTGYGMLNAWDALNYEPTEVEGIAGDRLLPPYPNPASLSVGWIKFPYKMVRKGRVEIRVYTVDGRLVWQRSVKDAAPGTEEPLVWNLNGASPGLYIAVLKTDKSESRVPFAIRP